MEFTGTHIPEITGALIMAAIGFYLTGLHNRKNRFADASIKFRSEIMNALENIYPTISIHITSDEINNKIWGSIPKIVTAATIFRYYLPFYRKGCFDRATKKYRDTAKNTDWNEIRAQKRFPVTYPGPNSLEIDFLHCVKNLLSYAKEK